MNKHSLLSILLSLVNVIMVAQEATGARLDPVQFHRPPRAGGRIRPHHGRRRRAIRIRSRLNIRRELNYKGCYLRRTTLAIVPYLLVRGPFNRIVRLSTHL